jgi:hypothetical protein
LNLSSASGLWAFLSAHECQNRCPWLVLEACIAARLHTRVKLEGIDFVSLLELGICGPRGDPQSVVVLCLLDHDCFGAKGVGLEDWCEYEREEVGRAEEFPDTESAIEECYGAGRTSVVAISLYQVVGELREIWADTSNKKT